jgi:enoyl-CoA hydratase/carnithine racemase
MEDLGSGWVGIERDPRGVACLTIENAAKLNTLNTPVMKALIDAAGRLATDVTLRVVVLRGAGDRAFVGGADIGEMATLDQVGASNFISLVHSTCEAFRRLPVPVIAAIQGWALGAGLELAAACDLRIASTDARFGMPEVRVGLPSVVEAALLPGLIGWGRTRRLLLSGETIEAETAAAWGLVEEVVSRGELNQAVARLVDGILASGPHAIRLQKQLIREWESLPMDAAIERGIACFTSAWDTDEPQRLMQRFIRRPRSSA